MRTPSAAYFEGAAVIGGRPAYLIAKAMRRAVEREHRANGGGSLPPDVAEAIDALERAGRVWSDCQEPPVVPVVPVVASAEAVVGWETAGSVPLLLSSAEVATRLGVSERRVRQLVGSGELPGRRSKGNWEFDPVVVNEYAMNRG